MRHGRDQRRGRYRKFLSQVEKTEAEAESRDLLLIAKAASDDWRAAAWRLERRWPRRFGPQVQLSVRQEFEELLTHLKLQLEPQAFEAVLKAITDGEAPAQEEA